MKKLLLQLLAGPLFLLGCGFGLPARYDESFLGELGDKCTLLAESSSPRIVLVGGSSLAFGVDSTLLEEEFPGYTVVNFGLYAALGTQMMLELSDGQFREGGHRHPLAGAAAADFVLLLQRRGRLAGAGRPF